MPLEENDKALVKVVGVRSYLHLYGAYAGHFQLKSANELGRACYQAGCSVEEVRGCIRHLVVVAGYGPCLAATNHLHAAKLLEADTPGKVGGRPGNAFELVYRSTSDIVHRKMHAVDPTLCEWVRLHLYGDVYSSPGLKMAQKQMLMVAFLAEADMHEQLFGHLIAALQFGQDKEACLKAIDIGFELASRPSNTVYKGALKTLQMAYHKYKKDCKDKEGASLEVVVRDSQSIKVPSLVLSNGFDEVCEPSFSISRTFSTASLPSYASIVGELPRTASEADILSHEREVGG